MRIAHAYNRMRSPAPLGSLDAPSGTLNFNSGPFRLAAGGFSRRNQPERQNMSLSARASRDRAWLPRAQTWAQLSSGRD